MVVCRHTEECCLGIIAVGGAHADAYVLYSCWFVEFECIGVTYHHVAVQAGVGGVIAVGHQLCRVVVPIVVGWWSYASHFLWRVVVDEELYGCSVERQVFLFVAHVEHHDVVYVLVGCNVICLHLIPCLAVGAIHELIVGIGEEFRGNGYLFELHGLGKCYTGVAAFGERS